MGSRTPNGKGAFARLQQFIKDNPHEELTFEDALVKFETNANNLSTAIWMLKARGEIEVVRVIRAKRVE